MKKVLKIFSLLLLFVLGLSLVACKDFEPTRKVSVIMPSGTPVLALGAVTRSSTTAAMTARKSARVQFTQNTVSS